jgi:hypothetical protein
MQRVVLHANDGKILTNGEIYGVCIFLAEGVKADEFYEITKDEYEKVLTAENEDITE